MGRRSWIVKATKDKLSLDLEGDEWIEVKSKLTVGEKRKIEQSAILQAHPDSNESGYAVEYSMAEYEFVRVMTWCTDWSFVDDNEKPIAFTRANLEALDEEAFNAIVRTLDEHIEKVYPSPKEPGAEEKTEAPKLNQLTPNESEISSFKSVKTGS